MKKLLFSISLLLAGVAVVNAQDTTSTAEPSTEYRTDETQTDDQTQDQDATQDPSTTQEEDATQDPSTTQDPSATQGQDATQDEGVKQDQEAEMDQDRTKDEDDMNKVAISTSELPATVQASLESNDYSGWTVSNAFRKEKDGQTVYAVEMKSGTETKIVKFDAQGNKLKEKDKDKDQ